MFRTQAGLGLGRLSVPGGIAEHVFGEVDGLVTCFGRAAAGEVQAVEMIGDVIEIVLIGVLLVRHQADGVTRVLRQGSEFVADDVDVIVCIET